MSIATVAGALALALWSGTRGARALIVALNLVYAERERRTFWHRQLLAIGLCLLSGAFVLGALALATPAAWGDAWMAAGFGGLHIASGLLIARQHGG